MRTQALLAAAALSAATASWWAIQAFQPPLGSAWIGFGLVTATGAAALAGARAPAAVCLVAGTLALGSLAGLGGFALAAPAIRVDRPDPNRELAARVLRLGQTLERHATREERPETELAYPRTDELEAFLGERLALPDALLRSPWGGPVQRPFPSPVHLLPTAAQRAAGQALPPLGSRLGPGRLPDDAPPTATTYGALVYDHDPETDTYVLYGIGEAHGQAIVVAAVHGAP